MKNPSILLLFILSMLSTQLIFAQDGRQARNEGSEDLLGTWQLMKMTDAEKNTLKVQKEGERDVFQFNADNTMSVTKMGKEASGHWKFSSSGNILVITDASRQDRVQYTVTKMGADELVLMYPDELNGTKLLFFSPIQ